jgi:hypothetical protein
MPSATIPGTITTQQAADALTEQLGCGYKITSHGTNSLTVKHGGLSFATVRVRRDGDATTFRVHGGGLMVGRAVHEALGQVDMACDAVKHLHRRELRAEEREALDFCDFQLGTIRDYMEPPGSPELEEAYKPYVSEPDVNR